LQAEKKAAQNNLDALQESVNGFRAETEKQKGLVSLCEKQAAGLKKALATALQASGFASAQAARTFVQDLGDEGALKLACKSFFEKYELYKHKAEETDGKKFADYDENALRLAEGAKTDAQALKDGANRAVAACETELSRLKELREKYLAFEEELSKKQAQKKLCDELKTLLKSNKFLEFIASEYLQEICLQASKTLLSLTGGRYFLKYEKEFKVGDNLDGGSLRAVKTLSGGETFLVSLSLALSLSAEICKKSLRPIEFFFLDEGFGTLDEKLVDTVMDVLGKLSKSFSVGLISHVEELKHRIGNKILVTGANERQGSKIKLERY
jgi:exonuclease SbcC